MYVNAIGLKGERGVYESHHGDHFVKAGFEDLSSNTVKSVSFERIVRVDGLESDGVQDELKCPILSATLALRSLSQLRPNSSMDLLDARHCRLALQRLDSPAHVFVDHPS